ncbi:competence type IV pilus minor pilin ComGF [Bacillus infantis]|uniref:competence type IV pilus minor pilin ComGF n=1 Tax=Bacillus infantis TaxID=324767 RepID=UPI003CF52C79
MRKRTGNKKEFVTFILKNNGFTLAEMLFGFSIFIIIASLLPLSLRYLADGEASEMRLQRMEWEIFSAQLKKEVHMSVDIEVNEGRLTLAGSGESVSFEKYGSNLRRRVNGKGHEVVLQNIHAASFSFQGKSLLVEAQSRRGENFHTVIVPFIEVNQNAPE